MAKSKARFLSELLGSTGLVKKSKSALAGADEVLDLDTIPTIPNSKLQNSSISIAGHSTALGDSVSLNTGNISEHTDYKYYTDARARGAVSVSGDLAYNSSTGVISFTERTDAEVRGLFSAGGSLSYNSSTGVMSFTMPAQNTSNITEGTNLYFTNARARSAISATGSLSYNSTTGVMSFTMPAQNTSNITEGSNLYYTNARADARIAAASTSDLSEGTNLYYTDARADARVALIVDSAPGTLNTLNELAAALGDDANFSTTVTNSIATKLPLAGGALTGAVTTNSTFDGRNVSVDGAKLDGIEAGATADQTAAQILTAIKTVDGSGSGLDADLLDGMNATDSRAGNTIVMRQANGYMQALYVNTTDDAASTSLGWLYGQRSNSDGYHRRFTAASIKTWGGFWASDNDGSGSGLDADLLDGQQGSYYNQSQFTGTAFTSRNSGNPIAIDSVTSNMVGYVNTSTAAGYADGAGFSAAYSSSWVGQLFVDFRTGKLSSRGKNNGTWQAHRFMWDNLNDGSGSGLDADLLDGQHGSYYAPLSSPTFTGNVSLSNGNVVLGTASKGFSTSAAWLRNTTAYGYIEFGPANASWAHIYTDRPAFYLNKEMRVNNSLVWNAGNDGDGSGLDADNLDGVTWATQTKAVAARNLTIEAGDGQGIGFWGGTGTVLGGSYAIAMSGQGSGNAGRMAFETTSDYNMYFKMSSGTNRGFVFKNGSSNVLNIDASGHLRANSVISSNNRQAMNCAHWSASGTSTGAVKITLPGSAGSVHSMPVIKIYTYQYSSTAHVVYTISGHDWSTGSTWYNTRVTAEGGPPLAVRLGHDGTNYCIIIGETNTSWSYGSATVELKAHPSYYNANQNFTTGWTATQITSMPSTVTAQTVGKIWDSSNDASGSGLDADLLDGQQGSYYATASGLTTATATANAALPKAGGTMTGNLNLSGSTNHVIIGGTASNNAYSTVASTTGLTFGGGNDFNNYSIGTSTQNIDGNYTKLNIKWHTGIRFFAMNRYGGVRFHSDVGMTTELMSIGNTDGHVRVANNLYVGSAVTASTVTATTFSGALSGNATTATTSHSWKAGGTMTGALNITSNTGVTGATAPSYTNAALEVQTSSNHVPTIGFHRGGVSATALYEYDGELYTNAWITRAQTGKLISSGNYNSYAPTLTGTGASGTWGINVTGSAPELLSKYPYSGSAWILDSTLAQNLSPGVGSTTVAMHNSHGLFGSWATTLTMSGYERYGAYQISGEYNSNPPRLAMRNYSQGLSGWTPWTTILSSANYNSYSPTLTGGGASGTWGINVTGSSASCTGNAATATTATTATTANALSLNTGKINLVSGAGGATFAANHYSMGVDIANSAWSNPHYSDLIIGYHTGIRIGASYGGTRFYDNSPTTDTNNSGNGNGTEALLMTVGGHAGGTGVVVHNALTVGTTLSVGTTSSFAGVADFNGGHGAINITNSSILSSASSTWTGNPGGAGKIQYHSNRWYIVADSSSNRIVQFRRDGADVSYIDNSGTYIGNAATATRASGNFYIDTNYGRSVIGLYSSTRYQGVYSMGNAYKLADDGSTTGNLYGLAWSHPNAGGAAGNLTDHGLLVINNGVFKCAISNSIVASGNITAYSDERLKKNWRNMPENFVSRLAEVTVGIYDRIDEENGTQVGVSAQSLQVLLPEAIITATDEIGTLSVNYGGAALASAVELAKVIVEQEKRIERLERLIEKLTGESL